MEDYSSESQNYQELLRKFQSGSKFCCILFQFNPKTFSEFLVAVFGIQRNFFSQLHWKLIKVQFYFLDSFFIKFRFECGKWEMENVESFS